MSNCKVKKTSNNIIYDTLSILKLVSTDLNRQNLRYCGITGKRTFSYGQKG